MLSAVSEGVDHVDIICLDFDKVDHDLFLYSNTRHVDDVTSKKICVVNPTFRFRLFLSNGTHVAIRITQIFAVGFVWAAIL